MDLGYDGSLFILAFDHRGSFQKGLFGISGTPTAEQTARIADAKQLIFEGFRLAIERGAPKDAAGVLVDEQFGGDVPRLARSAGYLLAMPCEKSGQDEFDLEYGDDFAVHIERFDPSFIKVLVRYNPEDDDAMNARQRDRLRALSDWLHAHDRKFLFELLVPPTSNQLAGVDGDRRRYDAEVRPDLVPRTIRILQDAGVDPDIWKIEGLERRADCERVAAQARGGGRGGVVCVVLGRGADEAQVHRWLRAGAGVPGYVGFAIGRTIWSAPLIGYRDGTSSRSDAVHGIATNYRRAIDAYRQAAAA